jgi:hypothetical protein
MFTKYLKIPNKNFSVFSKLKDFIKSRKQSDFVYTRNEIDPDKLKVEYEEPPKKKIKSKLKDKENKFTEEEIKILQTLPNNIVSNNIF